MIFIIHNHKTHNTNTMSDSSMMNLIHLFIFYLGLIILYHATTRFK